MHAYCYPQQPTAILLNNNTSHLYQVIFPISLNMSASRQLQVGSLRQRTTPSSNCSRVLSVGVSPFLLSHGEENTRLRLQSTNFVPQDEDAYYLSRAYVNAFWCDPCVGNNQKGDNFWRKVGQG
jgi:hypothetical protein